MREYRFAAVGGLAALAVLFVLIGCRRDGRGQPPPCAPCVPMATADIAVWQPVAGRTVILDAGHGGKDAGTGHFGLVEKDINLDLALRTAGLLRAKGVTVLFTRDSDVFIPLPERSALANRHPNAIFVSLHVNASEANPGATGVETFVLTAKFSDEDRRRAIAETVTMDGYDSQAGRRLLGDMATRYRGRAPALAASLQRSLTSRLAECDRGVKTANLAVLRETYFSTAVLVEVGFLSNEGTAERMRTESWRRQTSEALCEGIVRFLRQPES